MTTRLLLLLCLVGLACSSKGDEGSSSSALSCDRDRDCPDEKPDCREHRCRTRSRTDARPAGTDGGASGPDAPPADAPEGCVPRTCDDAGVECGEVSDGCDGVRYCGECEAPETCGGGGTPNFCGCTGSCCVAAYEQCDPYLDTCCGTATCRYYDIDPATGTYRYYCL